MAVRRTRKTFALLTGAVFLASLNAGCAPTYATPEEAAAHACSALGPRALSGALIGAGAGAAGGALIGAAAGGGRGAGYGALAGLLVGGLVGLAAGNHMDREDCARAQVALEQIGTAPVNEAFFWENPATGSRGSYMAVSGPYTYNDHICRRFKADYEMKGHAPVWGDTGVVCRTPNGDWARVSRPQT